MKEYLNYVVHVFNTPLSAVDQLKATVLIGLPVLFICSILGYIWKWFWVKYNDR